MPFIAKELSVDIVRALVPLMPRIKQRDKHLEDQLRRSSTSIGLNLSEAQYSDPRNRRARLFTAAGSAGETEHALRLAITWGYVSERDAEPALKLLRRMLAILWRMTRG